MAGLYYDPEALRSAEALIEGWSAEDRQKLRDDAPLLGLAAEARGRDLRSVAADMLAIARGGLKRRRKAQCARRGRDDPAPSARSDRRERPGAGAALDRALRRPMGPVGRPGLRRGGVLGAPAAPARPIVTFDRQLPARLARHGPEGARRKMRSRPAAGAPMSAAPAALTAPTNSGASSLPKGEGRPPIASSEPNRAPAAI